MEQKLVEKCKEAKSAKELALMAHEEGVDLSDGDADRYYAYLHSSEHELSDEELSNVSGGDCADSETEKSAKYEMHKADETCGDHSWSYMVYTGFVALAVMPGGRHCKNCHYSETSDKDYIKEHDYTYYYCTLHKK